MYVSIKLQSLLLLHNFKIFITLILCTCNLGTQHNTGVGTYFDIITGYINEHIFILVL